MKIDEVIFYKINHLPHNGILDGLAILLSRITEWGLGFIILGLINYAMPGTERKLLAKAIAGIRNPKLNNPV